MKLRDGFVSNSSSSSFIVTMKNGEKMTKETLLEAFDVKETSPLFGFANELSNWIIGNVKEQNIEEIYENYVGRSDGKSIAEMIDDIVEDYGGIDREDLEKIDSKEYRYYSGSACNDSGEALESYLCDNGINMDTDTIKIVSGDY
jgi:hypothetical protein